MRNACTIPMIAIARFRMGIDGTGIRTLICTYGCPLRCKYCPNPQSWDQKTKPAFYTAEELYHKVSADHFYFHTTGGGITFGGGEPLLHLDGIESFVALCPEDWSFWVETSLNVSEETVIRASKLFDCFAVDIKSIDPEVYAAYSGGELDRVLHNLKVLLERISPERVIVRVPQIPNYVDAGLQEKARDYLKSLGVKNIDMFAYWVFRQNP